MFEDSFIDRRRSGRPRFANWLLLGLSIVVHVFLVYGLFQARFRIKTVDFGPKVLSVRIVPPLNLTVPKVVGGLETGRPPAEKPLAGEAGAGPGGARRAQGGEIPPPVPASAQPSSPAGSPPGPQSPGVPALTSRFQQSVASRYKTGRESELTIVLAPSGSTAGPPRPPGKTGSPNFYEYIQGAAGGGRRGRGTGAATAGRGTGGQQASISIPLKGYNLAPWAQKVLELIVANWTLPPVGSLPERSRVKVLLMISKDGRVSSLELVEGAAFDELDQAAVRAIRASLPFPALPADFPGDFLEASIEFTYHD
jgi:TonB family protein